ncbi:TspO/MBR family protein [Bacillus sp. B1-b2]|uniref:TspO/MBR family protein n=1 Tax=Bacillus sp. B1-b2 TaxID=2653201 RepID=UPI00126185B7|nr:TspO/MBR family protein [Bacillus sp. B1-b2]KAB7667592.1 tryptophan-rich sensory protein [Bacillus sp. B1-b2]
MKNSKRLGVIYLVFFAIMIFLNYWSPMNVGNVANANQPLIQPAGYAFSIWGLIYLLLVIWIIRIFVVRDTSTYEIVSYWPAVNFLFNGLWILAFTAQWLFTSVIIIFALLITLIIIYSSINKSPSHTFFEKLPFSFYISWVSVASILNVFVWLVGIDQRELLGMGEEMCSIIILFVATALAMWFSIRFKDFIYTFVFIWAFVGIYMETSSDMIQNTTLVLIVILVITFCYVVYSYFKNRHLRGRRL